MVLTCPPATSTSVEQVFLRGCQLLSYTCNALSGSSVQAFLCLGAWCMHDLAGVKNIIVAIAIQRGARLDTQTSVDA